MIRSAVAVSFATLGTIFAAQGSPAMADIRFITLDPGHFHASLVQKEMYPGVARKVHVYAPLGPDLIDHLGRVAALQPAQGQAHLLGAGGPHRRPTSSSACCASGRATRSSSPGRNRGKIDRIQSSLEAGFHALVDKPWILEAADLPKLERALATADERGLVALDIMTERFEVTSELQRELVNDPAVFGTLLPGSEAEPAVYMESVHHLMKTVAGAPQHPSGVVLRYRPAGRGPQRHRHAPGGPRAVDALPGPGPRPPEGRPGAARPALADAHPARGVQAGDPRGLPGAPRRPA